MTGIVIRTAQESEAEQLSDLILRSKRSNGYDDVFMALCVEELRVTAERLRDELFWVAQAEDGELCGCTSLRISSGEARGEVRNFFVDPSWKRKGVGKQLWSVLLEAARAARLRKLHLDADPSAVSFYEAMGFRLKGEKPSGSIPGRFIPYMELSPDILAATERSAS